MLTRLTLRPSAMAKAMIGCGVVGFGMLAGQAHAIGLLAAYEAALKNDPTYKAAFYENEGSKENRIMARSALLPSLTASYSAQKFHEDVDTMSEGILGPETHSTQPKFVSRSAMLNLRQPLINYEATARYRSALAQTAASQATFTGRAQETAIRVVTAYLDALYSTDILNLAKVQLESYKEQAQANARMFEKGEGTRTDMIETQARLELSQVQLTEAMDNQANSMEALNRIVGEEIKSLDPLVPDFKIPPVGDMTLDDWKKLALANNADIQVRVQELAMAKEEINKAKSGHMPRLDVVAGYGRTAAETLQTSNQDALVRSVGVQLSVPLYSGGFNSAASRQAVSNYERAKSVLQATTDKAYIDLRKQYLLQSSSASRIAALTSAVESAKLLVTATEQSIKGGIRINMDLLNARQQLFTAQRDLAQLRYGYLASRLQLRSTAGTLSFDDVREIAAYFK